ncbi:MAG: hypothetical protein Q6361_03885 [Candidatus Hermodarchaeota archaeon]|nr:hypothetical protein [Candidatus Hermodarchaeota archaeon]
MPSQVLQKVKSDTPQKALTRIVSQFHPGTERRDWRLMWEDSEERVYGGAHDNDCS